MSHPTAPTAPTAGSAELVGPWLRLWNGDYELAEAIIAPNLRLHAAMLDGASDDDVHDGATLVTWIAMTRSAVPDLTFVVEVGPLVDGDRVALRWQATGHYSGGFPGATAAPGTRVAFTGTDLLRVTNDRISEYWVNSDMHILLTQLAVRPA